MIPYKHMIMTYALRAFRLLAIAAVAVVVASGCSIGEPVSTSTDEIISSPGAPRAPCPPGSGPCSDLYVVAHYDDDIFFMNPDIETSLHHGNNVVVVYVSGAGRGATTSDPPVSCASNANCPAGFECATNTCIWDESTNEQYWTNRERGILDAYAQMTDGYQPWTVVPSDPGLRFGGKDQAILTHTLGAAHPGQVVTLIFMRLADTTLESLWSSRNDAGDLLSNYEAPRFACGIVPSHCPVNGQTTMSATTYKRSELIQALVDIMAHYDAT